MKEKILYPIWAALYLLCAGLGFIPNPAGFVRFLLILTSVLFFLPGSLILWESIRTENKKARLRIRYISICSLALTILVLITNVLSIAASEAVGNFLYGLLIVVSSPMICSQYWVLSLFLWSCLLVGSFVKSKK